MTKDEIKARIQMLEMGKKQCEANYNMNAGAIEELNIMLTLIEQKEAANDPKPLEPEVA